MSSFLSKFSPYRKALQGLASVLLVWAGAYLRHGFSEVGFDGWMNLAWGLAGGFGIYAIANTISLRRTSPPPVPFVAPSPMTSTASGGFVSTSWPSVPLAILSPSLSRYGTIPDLPDHRDRLAEPDAQILASLPPAVDLRSDPRMPDVWDQGQLGSCTAHGIGAALVFHEVAPVMPSRLFLYYNERAVERTVGSDSGAQIRDGLKVTASLGVCPESEWPYDIGRFTVKPDARCYTDAKLDVALTYQRVAQDVDQIRAQLAAGNLVVIGFTVYESFESPAVAKTGVVAIPRKNENALGGHCVALVGYDHAAKRFIARNSWGTGWGQAGYFSLPYSYVSNPSLASDFWSIAKVGAAA